MPSNVSSRTNLFGSIHAVRVVYAGMKQRRAGRIMLVSSGAGLIGIYGYTAYSASKFALHGFAEALRSEVEAAWRENLRLFPAGYGNAAVHPEMEHRPLEAAVIMGRVAPWSSGCGGGSDRSRDRQGRLRGVLRLDALAPRPFRLDGEALPQLVVRSRYPARQPQPLNKVKSACICWK